MKIISSLFVTCCLLITICCSGDDYYYKPKVPPPPEDRCVAAGEAEGLDCACYQSCGGNPCNAGQGVGFGGGKYCGTGVCCCGNGCKFEPFPDPSITMAAAKGGNGKSNKKDYGYGYDSYGDDKYDHNDYRDDYKDDDYYRKSSSDYYRDDYKDDYKDDDDYYYKPKKDTCRARGDEYGLYCRCRQSCAGNPCNAGQGVGFGGGKYCGTGVCCCGTGCKKPSFMDYAEDGDYYRDDYKHDDYYKDDSDYYRDDYKDDDYYRDDYKDSHSSSDYYKKKSYSSSSDKYSRSSSDKYDYKDDSDDYYYKPKKDTCESRGDEYGLYCRCRQSCAGNDCNAGQGVGFGGGKYCGTGVCCCGRGCKKPSFSDYY